MQKFVLDSVVETKNIGIEILYQGGQKVLSLV